MKKYPVRLSVILFIIGLFVIQRAGISSAQGLKDTVRPFNSREMALVNDLVEDMNSVVDEISSAIERNAHFRDPGEYPQQLGELIVRSKTALSRSEAILQEGESLNLQETVLNPFVSVRNAMEELHRYFLGLIDGQSNESLWESYQAGIAEFLGFRKEMEEASSALALEKGLVFDYLAELKIKLNPVLSANAEFLELLRTGQDQGKAYIAAKNAFEENTRALRFIRDIKIPIDVSGRTYEELMQCSSYFTDHFMYMRRSAALYVKSLDAEKDPLMEEMRYFVEKAEEMQSRGDELVRVIKEEF